MPIANPRRRSWRNARYIGNGLLLGTLLAGAVAARAQTDQVGQWSGVLQFPFRAIHMQLLPTGKVMFWSRRPEGQNPYLFDPDTNAITALPSPGYEEFCSSHTIMPDGGMLVLGGHDSADGDGLPNASIYNPFTNSWTALPNMNNGRWYPSSTVMGNGDVVVLSGTYGAYINNDLPQVFQLSTRTWRDLTNARGSLPLYPDTLLAPNGRMFLLGPNQMTRYLDTTGTGAWSDVANRQFPNRDYGAFAMYDVGKILYVGGGDPPTNTAEVIDLNATTPSWRYVGNMSAARRQVNATILPDGKVLVTGGVSGAGFNNMSTPVFTAEMWDPATEQFTTLAPMAVGRWYHSGVVLLPDGRLLSAGGDGNFNAEIYSPPYLFKGARPTLASAPGSVVYGQNFTVDTPDAANVQQANLIRLTSVTHSNNFEQRILRLPFTRGTNQLNLTAPSNPNHCPPGYYMLFLVNGNGVPSIAKFVRVGAATTNAATFVRTDTTTQGSWKNVYGREGYQIIQDSINLPAYATVTPSGVSEWNWTFSTTDVRALQRAASNERFASCWFSSSGFSLDVTLSPGTTRQFALYCLDWDANGRVQNVEIRDAATNALLDSRAVSNFSGGHYLVWNLTGSVRVTVAPTSGPNSVLSGYFFDPTVTAPQPPAAPTNLAATGGVRQVSLTWTGSAGATSYTVKRGSASGGPYTNVATGVTGTSHTDTGLANGTTYYYVVSAVNANGESGASNQASATTSALPAAPTNLTATAGNAQVALSWSAVSGATSYTVKRSTTNGGPYTNVATGVTGTTYTNTGLTNGTTYYYVASAVNAVGEGGNSNQAQATPTAPAAGTGLKGQYYDNSNFTTLRVTRTDATIAFNWGTGSPASTIGADTFSARWTGEVLPLYSETYTFLATADDGVRVWVNGVQLINAWRNQSATEYRGTITLTAGQRYSIRVEYYENTGQASMRLEWQSARQARQVIPASQLFPAP